MTPVRSSKRRTAPVPAAEEIQTPIVQPIASHTKRNRIILTLAGALLLAGAGFAYVDLAHTTPQVSAQQEVDALIAEIGALIVLPSDERPLVATVNDTELLKDQPFFVNAKKGDKVLIYNEARKAVLYSPALKRIIDVAPLGIATPTPK